MKTTTLTHAKCVMKMWRATKSEVTYEVELHEARALVQLLDRHGFTVNVTKMEVGWSTGPSVAGEDAGHGVLRRIYPDGASTGGRVTLVARRLALLGPGEFIGRKVRPIEEILSNDVLTMAVLSVGRPLAES